MTNLRIISRNHADHLLTSAPDPWPQDLKLVEIRNGRIVGVVEDTSPEKVKNEATVGRIYTDPEEATRALGGLSVPGVKYFIADLQSERLISSKLVQQSLRALETVPDVSERISACRNLSRFYAAHPELHGVLLSGPEDQQINFKIEQKGAGVSYITQRFGSGEAGEVEFYENTIFDAIEAVVRGTSFREKTESGMMRIIRYRPPERTADPEELASICPPELVIAGIMAMADMAVADQNMMERAAMALVFNQNHPDPAVRAATLDAYILFLKPPLGDALTSVSEFIDNSADALKEDSNFVRQKALQLKSALQS